MARVAIPVFRSRVSPVFDSSTRALIIDFEDNQEKARREIYLDEFSLSERVNILRKSKINTIICGVISDILQSMLASAEIDSIPGIAGDIDEVITAYISGRLHEPHFSLPGYKGKDSFYPGRG